MLFSGLPYKCLNGTKFPLGEVYFGIAIVLFFVWLYLHLSRKTLGAWTTPLIRYTGQISVGVTMIQIAFLGNVLWTVLHNIFEPSFLTVPFTRLIQEAHITSPLIPVIEIAILSFPVIKMLSFFSVLEYNEKDRNWRESVSKIFYIVLSPLLATCLIVKVGNIGVIFPLLFIDAVAAFSWYTYRLLRKEETTKDDVLPWRFVVVAIETICFAAAMMILIRGMNFAEQHDSRSMFFVTLGVDVMFILFVIEMSTRYRVKLGAHAVVSEQTEETSEPGEEKKKEK